MYGNQIQTDEIKELRRQGGRWLKSLREAAGLSQSDLADRLQMSLYTFISQIENGRGRIPPDRYQAWAAALGVSLVPFTRKLISFYDPITFGILFDSQEIEDAPQKVRGTDIDLELSQLRDKVSQLERLLGKKTAQLELLKEQQESDGRLGHQLIP